MFNCPTRKAVYAETYQEACDINEKKTGKRISKQAWNITPKIREADKIAQKLNLRESHPEVFFKELDSESVENSKNSEEGFQDRREVLEKFGDTSPINDFSRKSASKDDIIDAMVLALGTKLELESIPMTPARDSKNLKMQILKPT